MLDATQEGRPLKRYNLAFGHAIIKSNSLDDLCDSGAIMPEISRPCALFKCKRNEKEEKNFEAKFLTGCV